MDSTQYVMAAFALVGLVNGINFALDKEWKSFIKFLTAVIAGGVFGFLNFFGLPSFEVGLIVGLSSSGVYKTGQLIGGLH